LNEIELRLEMRRTRSSVTIPSAPTSKTPSLVPANGINIWTNTNALINAWNVAVNISRGFTYSGALLRHSREAAHSAPQAQVATLATEYSSQNRLPPRKLASNESAVRHHLKLRESQIGAGDFVIVEEDVSSNTTISRAPGVRSQLTVPRESPLTGDPAPKNDHPILNNGAEADTSTLATPCPNQEDVKTLVRIAGDFLTTSQAVNLLIESKGDFESALQTLFDDPDVSTAVQNGLSGGYIDDDVCEAASRPASPASGLGEPIGSSSVKCSAGSGAASAAFDSEENSMREMILGRRPSWKNLNKLQAFVQSVNVSQLDLHRRFQDVEARALLVQIDGDALDREGEKQHRNARKLVEEKEQLTVELRRLEQVRKETWKMTRAHDLAMLSLCLLSAYTLHMFCCR
jgi:hypothetical protein